MILLCVFIHKLNSYSCAFQVTSKAHQLSANWHQVWQLASGAVSSLQTSRAACFLLNQLLELELVQFSAVSQSLDAMLQLSDIAGPAALADSSVRFWRSVVQRKLSENPSASSGLPEKLLQWLFTKWTPSKTSSHLLFRSILMTGRRF
jgi:ataxia telangiectasia mutated family protein